MLLQIRDYISREKVISNQQLSREFGLDLSALQPMLDILLRKGIITYCQQNSPCQTACFKCQSQPPVYYQYCYNSIDRSVPSSTHTAF